MHKTDLTEYDVRPPKMINYLRYNGPHFTKKLLAFAVSLMSKGDKPFKKYKKEDVDELLKIYGITLENNQLYDYVYIANMASSDFLGSSIITEDNLAKYIKDVIDDPDGYDGLPFTRWYADLCKKGIPIDWEEML